MKTFTKKTELVFTTIEIEKRYAFFGGEVYEASFKYGFSKKELIFKEIHGTSLEHCLQRLKKFLDFEIDERHYIIK